MALLTVPAGAEDMEAVPYPARTFLYIVDCSGSMKNYQEVLNVGRQMLLDLLPKENTIVVAFKNQPYTPEDTLQFSGETSVLSGIMRADEILEELWHQNPEQEVTAVLFSDMCSTVAASDGMTPLTEALAQAENEQMADIAKRWNGYTAADKLRVYSLNWSTNTSEDEEEVFPMSFTVLPPPSADTDIFRPLDSSSDEFSQEMLKLCVEVYASVLTGGSGFEWEDTSGTWADDILTVPLSERYREFLFLNEVPTRVVGPSEETLKCWPLSDGCILMLESGEAEVCSIEGVSSDTAVQSLVIPQPRIEVTSSEESMTLFSPVTISVAATDGKNYLGYDSSNSICLLKVTAPEEEMPQMLSCEYDLTQNSYQFTYTPEALGSHTFELTYIVLGAEPATRTFSFEKEAAATCPEPSGYRLRDYRDLTQNLQNMTKEKDIEFKLSDYFMDPHMQLEFVVKGPKDPKIATWESSTDQTGEVTVQGVGAGTTTLQYTVKGYIDGSDTPCCSENYELTICVTSSTQRLVPVVLIAAAIAVAIAVIGTIVFLKTRQPK